INMAETYWRDGIHEKKAIFELFFRRLPFENGYAVFAGLEKAIEYLENFKFTDSDLNYLQEELGYHEDFIEYLRGLTFTGSLY
ncbi:nicotinate phosphoribosyltransferase, partial [Xanthomonas citri pv. citri]|nr:nicotinate phosphoribosyltransferase [Xanthomonas citri pv. citri]